MTPPEIENARMLVRRARRIVGFTGAGISTESAIPDFRSPGGVWSQYRLVTYQEFLANEEDRIEYWRQKLAAWPAIRDARPNRATRPLSSSSVRAGSPPSSPRTSTGCTRTPAFGRRRRSNSTATPPGPPA